MCIQGASLTRLARLYMPREMHRLYITIIRESRAWRRGTSAVPPKSSTLAPHWQKHIYIFAQIDTRLSSFICGADDDHFNWQFFKWNVLHSWPNKTPKKHQTRGSSPRFEPCTLYSLIMHISTPTSFPSETAPMELWTSFIAYSCVWSHVRVYATRRVNSFGLCA